VSSPKTEERRRNGSRSIVPVLVFCAIALALFLLIWSSLRPDETVGAAEEDKRSSADVGVDAAGGQGGDGDAGQANGGSGSSQSAALDGPGSGQASPEDDPTGGSTETGDGQSQDGASGSGSGTGPSGASGYIQGKPGHGGPGSASPAVRHGGNAVEETPPEKMFFEGRWIEKAVRQRKEEMYLRRAYEEVRAQVQQKYGNRARLSPLTSESTVSTGLEPGNSFLIIARLTITGEGPHRLIAEVVRSPEKRWKVEQMELVGLVED